MPFKRPAPLPSQSSSQSQSESSMLYPTPSKRPRISSSAKALQDVKIYIVQAKLDVATISELYMLAERNADAVCRDPEDADVIVTAVHMRRRLERHVPWKLAKTKAIVTTDWLRDSVKAGKPLPCDRYVALEDLHETVRNCPDCKDKPCTCPDPNPSLATSRSASLTSVSIVSTSIRPSLSSSPAPIPGPATVKSEPQRAPSQGAAEAAAETPSVKETVEIPAYLLPPDPPIPTNVERLDYKSRFACQRASPLVCPNQALAEELNIICKSRALEGEARSALSYERAISVVKAYPYNITSVNQVQKLPYIGTKISGLVEEYLDTGRIYEAQTTLSSTRYQTLSLFSSIYGIGPNTAQRLYALGLRTLEDLEIYYGVDSVKDMEASGQIIEVEPAHPRGRGPGGHAHESEVGLGDNWVRIALGLREDLAKKIPRAEVKEMGDVVMRELDELEPGCVSTIVGGYRRGKQESNDVDMVFTHPDPSKAKGLCKRFVRRLHERGMVTHVMHLSGFHAHNTLRMTHWDSLEKALTVFILPPSSPHAQGIRRRLDLIFAQPEVYWTAVIGWSGSVMFQRDLREWAKKKCGMKFDSSGITRRYDSKQLYPKTEKEVFDLFGLEWVDPTLRNADV
ncbi:Nucleotidyltransferase [Obba rivulosa]|uniref:DNA polymerase lambda n=1 Tax=Obba rivulosa TaxID=1052685 RepID=A0A8E2J2P8_9APHY|nr:Nucleotidyltransferase [Obba rivulosa]